jgi:peptide chain release factor subunit 1
MIRQEDLQELLAFHTDEGQVVSLYLNADISQQTSETIKMQVRAMLKEAGDINKEAEVIEHYLDFSYDWSMPGLAIFSCANQDFFRSYTSAITFRNRVRVNNTFEGRMERLQGRLHQVIIERLLPGGIENSIS